MKNQHSFLPKPLALVPVLLLGGLAFATRLVHTELEGHAQLRAAVLEQLATTAKVRPSELLLTSAGPGHVIAGAPPEPRIGTDDALGHVLLNGQGPWRGGESLPDGVYLVRRGEGSKGLELVDDERRVVAVFTMDFPMSSGGNAAVAWPRIYLALVRELVPLAR